MQSSNKDDFITNPASGDNKINQNDLTKSYLDTLGAGNNVDPIIQNDEIQKQELLKQQEKFKNYDIAAKKVSDTDLKNIDDFKT